LKFIVLYYLLYSIHFLWQGVTLSNLYIYFLNVGQGDAIFIKSPTTLGLVDGGPDYGLDYSIDNKVPFFSCNLNYILATHPHKDHVKGLDRLLKRCKIGSVLINYVQYESKTWNDFVFNAKALSRVYFYPDLPKNLGGDYQVEFYAINSRDCAYDVNVCSLVVKIQSGLTSLLLTGDVYSTQLERSPFGHIDILKVPHHGGKNTLSETALIKLSPSIAILSYGEKNKYGHPAGQTTELLNKFNIKTMHTIAGDVLVKVTR